MPNAKRLPSGNWQVKVYSHTEYDYFLLGTL